jgi:hypothetical protein
VSRRRGIGAEGIEPRRCVLNSRPLSRVGVPAPADTRGRGFNDPGQREECPCDAPASPFTSRALENEVGSAGRDPRSTINISMSLHCQTQPNIASTLIHVDQRSSWSGYDCAGISPIDLCLFETQVVPDLSSLLLRPCHGKRRDTDAVRCGFQVPLTARLNRRHTDHRMAVRGVSFRH